MSLGWDLDWGQSVGAYFHASPRTVGLGGGKDIKLTRPLIFDRRELEGTRENLVGVFFCLGGARHLREKGSFLWCNI